MAKEGMKWALASNAAASMSRRRSFFEVALAAIRCVAARSLAMLSRRLNACAVSCQFLAGFLSRPLIGMLCTAVILVCVPVHAELGASSGDVEPAVPELGGHALAGALEMSVQPSTGVFHATLPIELPPARGGPQPGLGIHYSSAAGISRCWHRVGARNAVHRTARAGWRPSFLSNSNAGLARDVPELVP